MLDKHTCGHKLIEQHHNVEHKNHHNDFGKHQKNVVGFAAIGHIQEDAKDVDGQQRNDDFLNHALNDGAKLIQPALQHVAFAIGHTQTHHESQYQSAHHIHQSGNVEFKERLQRMRLFDVNTLCGRHQRRKEPAACAIGQQASQHSVGIGQHHRHQQNATRRTANVGNSRSHHAQDDERNHKT